MKTRRVKARCLALLVGLMLCCIARAAQVAEQELRWDALEVDAHLNADGVLDVIERHTMVFTGAWNGGERVFDVRPRQKLEFVDLVRIDAKTGTPQPLLEASVPNNVDEFTWADSRTLRWRSRLPSDPPFENTRLTYVLHYTLSGILRKDDTQYQIHHDFAFPDRSGPIAHFTLNLDLDPVWQPLVEFPESIQRGLTRARAKLRAEHSVELFRTRYAGGDRHWPSARDSCRGVHNPRGLCVSRARVHAARTFPWTLRYCRHAGHRRCMD